MVRLQRQCQTASRWPFLAGHDKVSQVWYPGHASHRSEVAAAQMDSSGAMRTFAVADESALKVADGLELAAFGASLRTAVQIPPPWLFWTFSRTEMGILDGMVRISTGLEDRKT